MYFFKIEIKWILHACGFSKKFEVPEVLTHSGLTAGLGIRSFDFRVKRSFLSKKLAIHSLAHFWWEI